MKRMCWKSKALKQLSFGKRHKCAGRNSSGSITVFHRGGGSKRLQRRIDFRRNILSTGLVERIEYDPNRSSRIALVRWSNSLKMNQSDVLKNQRSSFTYILASEHLLAGDQVLNVLAVKSQQEHDVPGTRTEGVKERGLNGRGQNRDSVPYVAPALLERTESRSWDDPAGLTEGPFAPSPPLRENLDFVLGGAKIEMVETGEKQSHLDFNDLLYQKVGNCLPLANIPSGTTIHNIEWHPGQGGKLVRAAGAKAQLIKKLDSTQQSVVRLPSGVVKLLDSRCRATIGIVSNASNSTQKLTKAGQSRWLGRRPVVRGVAMNPIDHPHGGGEGRAKGRNPVSPWGKPSKGGFKTVIRKRKT